jgi:hypothetical protein
MSIPPIESDDANKIVRAGYVADSAWYIHAALCWLAYAEKHNASTALFYAALNVRMGIEHLWFDIFVVSKGNSISEQEYQKAVAQSTKLYKLIDTHSPDYVKFVDFTQMMNSFDSNPHPPTIIWDINRLKRIHGECSERLLHFGGKPHSGYRADQWCSEQIAFLSDSANWMWNEMTSRGNLVVYKPESLQKPEVYEIWQHYQSGALDREGAKLRLQIIQPALRARRIGWMA